MRLNPCTRAVDRFRVRVSAPFRTACAGVVLAALVFPQAGWGAGFGIYEQGGRALGMAGAYTARVGDASAIYFNPAGLAVIEHGSVQVGTSMIYVSREFAGTSPYPGDGTFAESPRQAFFPVHGYWGHRLGPDVVVGFGIYNPYGLTTEWKDPDTFSGRFISTRASLTPFYFNPVVALNLAPYMRIGVGVMAVHSSLKLNRHVGQPNPLGDPGVLDLGKVELSGDNGLDYGVNLGLQFDVTDAVTVGANYRSGIEVDFDGDADFTFLGTGTPLDPQLRLVFPADQKVNTTLEYPMLFVFGLGVTPVSGLSLEGDLGWTQWSSFDRLAIQFEDDPSLNLALEENWDDAFFFRMGGEYAVNASTRLRLGYYYDETPQPTLTVSPILPDNNRHGLSAGVGKTWGKWGVDVFGLLLLMSDRGTDGINRDGFEGTYANGVQILGATVSYVY